MILKNNPPKSQWSNILKRPTIETKDLESAVSKIMQQVKVQGDQSLIELTTKFDKVQLSILQVNKEEITAAIQQVDPKLKAAIQQAKANIEQFHTAQKEETKIIETMPGVQCWRKSVAIEKVGLYIPGGTAPLFSTVLMLGVPAQIAGCSEIILCTPPQKDGTINPAILYTADLVGITKVFKVGGAQAIAAMAYGTETIPAINKIFGPGNQYVTEAKQQASRAGVAIDLPAGPSEVLVVADGSAEPAFVAADLLSQAEHGADSQVVLIAFEEDFVTEVNAEIGNQIEALPRKSIAQEALKNSVAIIVENKKEALDLINFYAPEHLIVATDKAELFAENIKNAGSVFLGNYTPESAGDYASGTNHTLPTNGYAAAYSGVSLDSFVKKITFQKITKMGLQNLGPSVELMAAAEQLEAHKNAISIRLKSDDNSKDDLAQLGEIKQTPISSLVRRDLKDFLPYSSARDEFEGTAEVYLDANENPFQTNLNRYPDPMQKDLKNKIGELKGIKSSKIFLGNGSDEAIDLLIRLFCERGNDSILILPPTYGVYSVFAKIAGVQVKTLALDKNFQPSIEALNNLGSKNSKILFICNPNNPTGSIISIKKIQEIISNFSGIVVVDEAYIDFSETQSCISLIDQNPNLVVLQTFSKAWGLAGLRLGMAFSNPDLINWINKIKMPYNINSLTQQTVLEKLENKGQVLQEIQTIKNERAKLDQRLKDFNFIKKVFPSEANFILAETSNADELYDFLLKKGIIVRNRSKQFNCENCLRFTIGTSKENQKLITALKVYQEILNSRIENQKTNLQSL